MAEEIRQILEGAVAPPERVGDLFLEAFGPANGVDLDLPPREPHESIVPSKASPLDVEGVDLGLSAEEIISAVRGRRARDGN
jgi:fumarate hydratase class II